MSGYVTLFLSMGVSAAAIITIVSSFADPSLRIEIIITVLALYFVMWFFHYMRLYAKEQRERTGL